MTLELATARQRTVDGAKEELRLDLEALACGKAGRAVPVRVYIRLAHLPTAVLYDYRWFEVVLRVCVLYRRSDVLASSSTPGATQYTFGHWACCPHLKCVGKA